MLKNLKISTRLALGFAFMAALLLTLAAASWMKIDRVADRFDDLTDARVPKLLQLQSIKLANANVARAMRELMIVKEPVEAEALFAEMDETAKRTSATFKTLEAAVNSDAGRVLLDRLSAARAAYSKPRQKVIQLFKAGQLDEARQVLLIELRGPQQDYMAAVDGMIDQSQQAMDKAGEAVDEEVATARWTVAVVVLVSLVGAVVVALWIIRSTTRPVYEAVRVASAVAAGDLSLQFDASGTSETAQLLAALQGMQERLAAIVADVRLNAEGVATASAQISSGNSDLSMRTESQASALEETAASMEQLGSTVRANADNAHQANQLALAASNVAAEGGAAVQQVVRTMKGISESSGRIADIIGTIDGIAFQTNILALNAAVEAARAGEQGRGFAVVASEVRSLAQRSAEAAKEIKTLISQSVERVEEGTRQVDQAGATIEQVVTSIRRVTDIVGEISSASREQASGVGQVGEAVTAMDQVTQQNAALVEESAAAAESLKTQADKLVSAVAVFKLSRA